MATSSFLTLADGREVRFDFTAPGQGDSSLGFQLLGADEHPLGPETTIFQQAPAIDVVQQVDGFSGTALTGGGFVVAYELRGGPVVFAHDVEQLRIGVFDSAGHQVRDLFVPIGQVPDRGSVNLGAFGLGGDGFAVVFDHASHETEHLAFDNGGGLTDLALRAPVASVANAEGILTLGFADGGEVTVGGEGADRITGGDHGDLVRAGNGADTVEGGTGPDDINGNAGNDLIHGGAGDDVLRGGKGDDLIEGGAGNDWISGDRGFDTLTGGAGADIFHASADPAFEVVTDFNYAEGDRIQLDAGTPFFVFQHGADVAILLGVDDRLDSTGIIELKNVQLSSLPPGFITLG